MCGSVVFVVFISSLHTYYNGVECDCLSVYIQCELNEWIVWLIFVWCTK